MNVTDPQIAGVADDMTLGGHVRSKNVRSDLVMVPFRNSHYLTDISGSPTTAVNFQQYASPENADASNGAIFVVVGPGANSGARIRFWFYGTIFGLRWQSQLFENDAGFGVLIDGMPYPLLDSDREPTAPTLPQSQDGRFNNSYKLEVVAEDLTDGKHLCEIHFPSNPASGNPNGGATGNNGWFLWGFLAEKRAGYAECPRLLLPVQRTTTLTNSFVTIDTLPQGNSLGGFPTNIFRYFRCIKYTNTSISPVTVTVENFSHDIIWQTVLAAAGSAGCSDTFDPGGPFVGNPTYNHYASAGSAVNATVFGGY